MFHERLPFLSLFPQTVNCWGSQCCLKCVRLGWGAVSASLSLSPVTQFVPPFVSHLTLAGVLCPPRWACLRSCLPICLPPGFVFHLGWGAVSASLGLSPNLSPTWLCLWACLRSCLPICLPSGCVSQFSFPICFPSWLCLSPWLGCCVRLAGLVSGLVSQFVSQFVSPICFPPSFAFHLGFPI